MPPKIVRRLISVLAPPSIREELLDQLDEGFARRCREDGAAAARRWLWRQALSLDWIRLRRAVAEPKLEASRNSEELVHSSLQDVVFAVRSFRRSLGFVIVAVLTLALGIGANVALMSVVRAVLLQPLPYGGEARLVNVWSQWTGFPKTWLSLEEFRHYRAEAESFEDVALYDSGSGNLTGDDEPEWIGLAIVTANLFDVLGVSPLRGRVFTAEESAPGRSDTALISHALWQRRYGGDPELVGRRIEVDGTPRTVVGILPQGFQLPIDFGAETRTDVYVPLGVPEGSEPLPRMGGSHGYYAMARLAAGVDLETARAELRALNDRAESDGVYPEEWRFRTLLLPVRDDVLGEVRPALLLLLGAVGFVLLIACTNVANLVLSRGHERRREIALRTALGARSSRVFRQLLTESVVLTMIGGAAGVALAHAALRVLVALEPGSIPRLADARVDGGALFFALGLTAAVALLFGALPALSVSRTDLRSALGEGGKAAGAGLASQRLRSALVVVQMALAVVLVAGAGLTIRTFTTLVRIDPGFRAEDVLTMRISLPAESYPDSPSIIGFYDRLLERVRELPGVEEAAAVRVLPLASEIGDWGTEIEGYVPPPGENPSADWQVATDRYFETIGIRLVEGRTFDSSDRADGEPVAIVNEAFVRRYWPGESGLGKRILIGGADEPPFARVVGIAGDVRHNGITAEIKPKWYRPLSQFHQSSGFTPRAMTLTVKGAVAPHALADPVRRVVRELDPKLPLAEVRTLDEVVASAVASSRFTMTLLVLFSSLALALAAVGVYGVVSYLVSQRTPEIGLRMALGASRRTVLGMVLGKGLLLAVLGIALGSGAALLTTRLMGSVLYGVGPRDPATFVLAPVVLLVAALLGSGIPALRAARVDPVVALKAE